MNETLAWVRTTALILLGLDIGISFAKADWGAFTILVILSVVVIAASAVMDYRGRGRVDKSKEDE